MLLYNDPVVDFLNRFLPCLKKIETFQATFWYGDIIDKQASVI